MSALITPNDLARVLRAAADEAERIAAEHAEARADWIDQHHSNLGRRRHCVRVRARLAAGLPGAAIIGRRYLLSDAAHAEEVGTLSRRQPQQEPLDAAARLCQRLGLVGR